MTTTQTFAKHPSRNESTFATLINESYQKVYSMAYRLSGNRQDAEDLTQEACYRAFRSFDDFEGDRPFTNWIYRIVTRLYLDLRRNRSRRVSEVSMDAPLGLSGDSELHLEPADTRPTPEMLLISGVVGEEMQAALNELTPEQLELVKMADVCEMDGQDISDKLAKPNGTIRSRLHRAHLQMRRQLSGETAAKKKEDYRSIRKVSTTSVRRTESFGSNWMTTSLTRLTEKFS